MRAALGQPALSMAWAQTNAARAKQDLEALAKELDVKCPGAAPNLRGELEQPPVRHVRTWSRVATSNHVPMQGASGGAP